MPTRGKVVRRTESSVPVAKRWKQEIAPEAVSEADARRERKLIAKDLQLLQAMFARTEKLYRPKEPIVLSKTTTNGTSPIHIALLSRPTWIVGLDSKMPDLERFAKVDRVETLREKRKGELLVTASKSQKLWEEDRSTFLREVEKILADEHSPRLLIVNELGYPWRKFDKLKDKQLQFERKLIKLVRERNLVLIAGTYHSPKGQNLAAMFAPELAQPILHPKMHSALAVEERIAPPADDSLHLYEIDGRVISILVCVDAFVPSLAMRLARFNHMEDEANLRGRRIDIVVVPSFYPGHRPGMSDACGHLSRIADCTVAFVNCAASKPKMTLFVSGEEQSRKPRQYIGSDETHSRRQCDSPLLEQRCLGCRTTASGSWRTDGHFAGVCTPTFFANTSTRPVSSGVSLAI